MKPGTVLFEVIKVPTGFALTVGDEDCGYRLAGPKASPGKVVHSFVVDVEVLRGELDKLCREHGHVREVIDDE